MLQITAKHFADMQTDPATRLIWQQEAEKLRLPYWDFCRPSSTGVGGYAEPANLRYGMPAPMAIKYVRVKRPNSAVYENILNPLYSYTYPTDAALEAAYPYNGYGQTNLEQDGAPTNEVGAQLKWYIRRTTPNGPNAVTARWPDANGRTQTLALEREATKTVDIQRMRVFYTITNVKDFVQVSCSSPIRDNKVDFSAGYTASLENIHDDYHLMIGGTSQLSQTTLAHTGARIGFSAASVDGLVQPVRVGGGTLTPPHTAGFEPGFWMMHGFYEYTQCLWQTVHPDRWWEGGKYKRGFGNCVWLTEQSLEGPNTPLVPLRRPRNQKGWLASKVTSTPAHEFWTPETARDWTQFGYTYEGCPGPSSNPVTKRARRQAAIQRVKTAYGWIYPGSANAGVPQAFLAAPPAPDKAGAMGLFDGTGTTSGKFLSAADVAKYERWDPPNFVLADIPALAAMQPLIVFGTTHSWYPRLINPANPLNDATTMADLAVDVAAPPLVVLHATARMGFDPAIAKALKNAHFGIPSPPATGTAKIVNPKTSSPGPVVAEAFVDDMPSRVKAETELKALPNEQDARPAWDLRTSRPTDGKSTEVAAAAAAAATVADEPKVGQTLQTPPNPNK